MFTDSPISFIVKTAFGRAAKLVAGGDKRASQPSGNLILGQIEADNRIREFPTAKKERRRRQTFNIHSRLDPAALATYISLIVFHKRTSWPLFKDNLSKTLGRPRMDFIYCATTLILSHYDRRKEIQKKAEKERRGWEKKSKKPTRSIREHSTINARSCPR